MDKNKKVVVQKKKKKVFVISKKTKIIIITAIIACVIAGGFSVYKAQHSYSGFIQFDNNAQTGTLPGKSQSDVQNEINEVVADGMFNISINPEITVDKNTMVGDARIENIKANHYLMQVDIKTADGSKIYSSGAIRPGEYVSNVTFNTQFGSGEHPVDAVFTAINGKDGSVVGHADAQINLIVK